MVERGSCGGKSAGSIAGDITRGITGGITRGIAGGIAGGIVGGLVRLCEMGTSIGMTIHTTTRYGAPADRYWLLTLIVAYRHDGGYVPRLVDSKELNKRFSNILHLDGRVAVMRNSFTVGVQLM